MKVRSVQNSRGRRQDVSHQRVHQAEEAGPAGELSERDPLINVDVLASTTQFKTTMI
jgi:hypothetical protein